MPSQSCIIFTTTRSTTYLVRVIVADRNALLLVFIRLYTYPLIQKCENTHLIAIQDNDDNKKIPGCT